MAARGHSSEAPRQSLPSRPWPALAARDYDIRFLSYLDSLSLVPKAERLEQWVLLTKPVLVALEQRPMPLLSVMLGSHELIKDEGILYCDFQNGCTDLQFDRNRRHERGNGSFPFLFRPAFRRVFLLGKEVDVRQERPDRCPRTAFIRNHRHGVQCGCLSFPDSAGGEDRSGGAGRRPQDADVVFL